MELTVRRGDYEAINGGPRDDTNQPDDDNPPRKDDNLFICCLKKTKEYCAKAPKYLYDHTIGSCSCRSWFCCGEKADYYYADQLKSIDDLRKILRFHFMSPFQKWNFEERRRFPWKLFMQLFGVILVTIQIIFFARTKFHVTDFLNDNSRTFSNLFVANPLDMSGPNDPIPSPIAYLYTMDEILNQINFTATAYFDLQNRAVGTYGYEWVDSDHYLDNDTKVMRYLILKVTKYANGKIDPTYLSVGVKEQDIDQYNISEDDLRNPNRSIADAIMWSKLMEEINIIEKMSMELKLSSVSIIDGSTDNPRCFQFTILLTVRRDYDSGNMPLTLKVQQIFTRDCKNGSRIYLFDTSFDSSRGRTALDGLVIIISTILIFLSGRSVINTCHLARRIRRFLKPRMNYKLNILNPLFDIWHILVIISNLLAVIGSIFMLLLSSNIINDVRVVDGTSIILGLAVFGQWCGILRFLSYLDKYNMLLRTLKVSAPNVMRFVVCTGILYIAFLLCGWLVMGPYHPKFRSLILSSECLFSLINGDDMFNTYTMASNSSTPILIIVFSKVYLYIFVALFIYVVLSVFISLIEDTYRTLHEEWLERKEKQSASDQLNQSSKVTSRYLLDLIENESHQSSTAENGNHIASTETNV